MRDRPPICKAILVFDIKRQAEVFILGEVLEGPRQVHGGLKGIFSKGRVSGQRCEEVPQMRQMLADEGNGKVPA
jgi:hypothetical protein